MRSRGHAAAFFILPRRTAAVVPQRLLQAADQLVELTRDVRVLAITASDSVS